MSQDSTEVFYAAPADEPEVWDVRIPAQLVQTEDGPTLVISRARLPEGVVVSISSWVRDAEGNPVPFSRINGKDKLPRFGGLISWATAEPDDPWGMSLGDPQVVRIDVTE